MVSFSCSPLRKSLVRGERFLRVEGKSDLLKLDDASWREMLSGTNDFLQAVNPWHWPTISQLWGRNPVDFLKPSRAHVGWIHARVQLWHSRPQSSLASVRKSVMGFVSREDVNMAHA